jgi:hypothetical protein
MMDSLKHNAEGGVLFNIELLASAQRQRVVTREDLGNGNIGRRFDSQTLLETLLEELEIHYGVII